MPKRILAFFSAALLALAFLPAGDALGATNINSAPALHWAWSDEFGWIDFYISDTAPNAVNVNSTNLIGYASSSAGEVAFDRATSPNPGSAGAYQVLNDRCGNLSGWGWNDTYGWISFNCKDLLGQDPNACNKTLGLHETHIDTQTGDFHGFAWNDVIGWIFFNCADLGGVVSDQGGGVVTCTSVDFKVNTTWRSVQASGTIDSAVFDTGVSGGAELNSIMWRGGFTSQTSVCGGTLGAKVQFKIAASNSVSGPWSFLGPGGSTSPSDVYEPTGVITGPNVPIPLNYTLHNNKRYFRYRAILFADPLGTVSPRVDDIIINWSP